jgi:hypothetical protein
LVRDQDVSGVSGTGVVAEGVEFANGLVVMAWLSDYPTVTLYQTIAHTLAIHGHQGKSRIEWLDKE